MDDLISRQAAIDAILHCENHDMKHDFEFNEGLIVAMNALDELPTAEKKGKWIKDRLSSTLGGSYGVYRCSECESSYQDIGYGWNYCPNCGAKMEN